ncbi:MAG: AMP-binding protein, partial [Mycobacterium sp.]|nr:AMP-binding protein [Mycobacterium sp.]
MSEAPVLTTLRERASLQPDDVAFTFTDYDADWAGVTETITWVQLYRRVDNLARAISGYGESGDRAVILAHQSLDYIVAFLGSMLAGYIAVPLSAPSPGAPAERAGAWMADPPPAVVLTTSGLVETVGEYPADTAG